MDGCVTLRHVSLHVSPIRDSVVEVQFLVDGCEAEVSEAWRAAGELLDDLSHCLSTRRQSWRALSLPHALTG